MEAHFVEEGADLAVCFKVIDMEGDVVALEVGPPDASVLAIGRDLGRASMNDAEALGEALEVGIVAGKPVPLRGGAVDEVPAGEGGESVGDSGAREAGSGMDSGGGGAVSMLDRFVGEGCWRAETFENGAESVGLPSNPAHGRGGVGVAV